MFTLCINSMCNTTPVKITVRQKFIIGFKLTKIYLMYT